MKYSIKNNSHHPAWFITQISLLMLMSLSGKTRLRVGLSLVWSLLLLGQLNAQQWNNDHRIGTVNGVYQFNYNQTPATLVEIHSPVIGTYSLSYQWEQSSKPLEDFAAISGATQSSYAMSAPLTQTTYFRRKVTETGSGNFIYSNTVRIEVVSVQHENMNYVREHVVRIPSGSNGWSWIDQAVIGDKLQTTTYADGAGRTLQQISKETATPAGGTGLWGDQVQVMAYDVFGRNAQQHLPYTTTTQSGKFKTSGFSEQSQYYSNTLNETSPFINNTFDNSPLNRITNTKLAGTAWAASAGKSTAYELNTTADNVQVWRIAYTTGATPTHHGAYAEAELMKMRYTDENGKQVIEYADKSGLLILKKIQLDDSPSAAHSGWICTYSVYDDFGRLRFQMQPEAVKYLDNNSWSFAGSNGTQVVQEWCFRYEYDDKGRNILKKAPGAQPLGMIYDSRDRLVMMQDGNQAAKPTPEWTVNLYDELDRLVLTTLYKTSASTATLRVTVNNASGNASGTIQVPGEPVVDLVVDNRVNGITRYAATNSVVITSTAGADFVSENEAEFVAEIDANATTPTTTTTVNYWGSPISTADLNNPAISTPLKYLFYDHYQFAGVKTFNNQFANTQAYATNGQLIPAITAGNRTLSFPTGSRTRVLGTNIFLNATTYYDDEGRAIQQLEDNIKSGVDITTSQYHFDGRVMSVHEQHTAAGTGFTAHSILSKYLHDKLGRVTEVQQKMGSGNFTSIVSFEYDDRGRLKNKRLAPGYTGSGKNELENLAYSYNIQEQITGINKDYALKTNGLYHKWGNFFGLYLGYDNRDNVFGKAELNGQVTGLLWNTMGDDAQRKYDYGYDNAGRLTSAHFTQRQATGDAWSNSLLDFSVLGNGGKINYDHNGNILSMLQKGVVPGSAPMNMDDLQYTYAAYSNKLLKVTDNANSGTSNGKLGDFKDGSNGTADDYVYDNNGNLIIDLNKNVVAPGSAAGITYNHLDKPELIRISGKGTLQLVYDADGRKLQRNYTPEGGTAKKIFYAGRYVYEGETLQYIGFEEGRIRATQYVSQSNGYESMLVDGNMALPDGRKGTYDYFVRDYQGNVRMILTTGQHYSSGTATMETARAAVEEPVFGQTGGANEVAQSRFAVTDIPGQAWQHPNIGSKVSKLSKLAQKIGPNSLLKVMAGDEISASTQYFYKAPAGNTNGTTPINEVLQALLQTINGSGATNAVTKSGAANITGSLNGTTPFQNMVAPHAAAVDNIPKAYLTVLFFDERFKFVEEGSTYLRVNSADNSNANLTLAGIKAPKNGYVYVYVSNESDEPVYFDNLQVAHNRGRIVEENHYYAFGLKIAGISSRKLPDVNEGEVKNQYLYNDKELFDEGDLNWYDYGFRNYDAQIGRFTQLDPLTWEYPFLTPYQYASNDPITNIDIDGLEGGSAVKIFTGATQAAAELAASSAALAGNNLGEVIVTSSIKKVAKKASKSLLSEIGNKSLSMLIEAGFQAVAAFSDIRDKIQEKWENIQSANYVTTMVTGKGFVERTLDNALRFENMSIGPMGLGGSASKIFFRPQLQYHLVGPELNLKLAVPLKGGSVTELYQVVGTGIVYSTELANDPPEPKYEEANLQDPKSINQLNQDVKAGRAPKGIKRFDKGRGTKNLPEDEVHFDNGSSLYRSGKWRHDKGHKLTNKQIDYLKQNGWKIPE
jgi:RHS repeat-associated protein